MEGIGLAACFVGIGIMVYLFTVSTALSCKHEWQYMGDVFEKNHKNPYASKYRCTKCCKGKLV